MIPTEKPGTPAELVHFGVKGMKWGVRKSKETSSRPLTSREVAERSAIRRQRAKKVAIGVGVLAVVAGTAYIAYKLNQNGKLPLSSLRKSSKVKPQAAKEVKKIIEQTDIIHLAGGKTKGFQFMKQGGTPSHFVIWEKALGKYAHTSQREIFNVLPDGGIAARFMDPLKRLDQFRRPIHHEVIIPKTMTQGINNIKDVETKIWPLLKETYDYT